MPQFFSLYYATDCTENIYQKYLALKNLPSTTKAPVVVSEKPFFSKVIGFLISTEFILPCYITAVILFLFVLFLNQKKYNKSYALNFFCWVYIGIQLILYLMGIFNQVYRIIWKGIWDASIICQMDESSNPPKIARYSFVTFPRWYFPFDSIRNLLERSFFFYILPLLLGFHRINIYFACSHPLIYKKYLKESMLKFYYLFIGVFGAGIFMVRLFRLDFIRVSLDSSYAYDALFAFIQILSCAFHVVITILTVKVLIKYRKAQNSASLELKGFFYFSILPMILSIISMFLNTVYIIVALMMRTNAKNKDFLALNKISETASAVTDQLIIVLNPIFASILMFFCIPNYQKTFKRVFLRQKETESTIFRTQNTMSISSKVSVTSKRVTTHK